VHLGFLSSKLLRILSFLSLFCLRLFCLPGSKMVIGRFRALNLRLVWLLRTVFRKHFWSIKGEFFVWNEKNCWFSSKNWNGADFSNNSRNDWRKH
jgi:hypothetical protein